MSKQLLEAAASGDYMLVRKIFNSLNYEINYLGSIDEHPGVKYTPLAIALLKEHWTVAMMLISEGADVMMPGKVMDHGINYPISIAIKKGLPIDVTRAILQKIPNLNQFIIEKYQKIECGIKLSSIVICGLSVSHRRTLLETLYPCEVLLRGPLNVFEIYQKKNCQPYLTASMFENYINGRTITDDYLINIELGLQCLVELNCLDKDEARRIKQVAELHRRYIVPENLQQQLDNIQQRQDQIDTKLDKILKGLGEKQPKPSFTMY